MSIFSTQPNVDASKSRHLRSIYSLKNHRVRARLVWQGPCPNRPYQHEDVSMRPLAQSHQDCWAKLNAQARLGRDRSQPRRGTSRAKVSIKADMVTERISPGERRCTCSAPAFMWECEYFCSVTGVLCNSCTACIEFPWEARNENSTLAMPLVEEGA